MKIAYLASLYPAPSHTFIQREIIELQKQGVEIVPFSVRRSQPQDQLDETARLEAKRTRSLLPLTGALLPAFFWLVTVHPLRGLATLRIALRSARRPKLVLKWCAYFVEAVQLAYWLDREQVEHLHCHFGNAGSNTAWLAAKLAGTRFSMTFHGIDLDDPQTFQHRQKLADSDFAVCISDFGKSRLLENIDNDDAGKVQVVRCGFPVPGADAVPAPPENGSIICVARLSEEKGHRVLIEALRMLADKGVDFHCTCVGSGPLGEELVAQALRLGLENQVTFAGAVANDQVVRMIAASDISVLASFGEGIPIALLESLAWRRPFVATRVGGIPELVTDGASGLLAEPGDAYSLADCIERLLTDKALARQLADAGSRLVAERHDPKHSASLMLTLFQQAASREHPKGQAGS